MPSKQNEDRRIRQLARRADRSRAIFGLRNQGKTYEQIQRELGISHQTLWLHIRSEEYRRLVERLETEALRVANLHELYETVMLDFQVDE